MRSTHPHPHFSTRSLVMAGHTFNVGDVDVELPQFLTGPLNALIHRLNDLLGVLLHPSDSSAHRKQNRLIKSSLSSCKLDK